MKRFLALSLFVTLTTALGFAQEIVINDQLPKEVITLDEEHPLLIEVITNPWKDFLPTVYQDEDVTMAVAEMVYSAAPNVVFAEDTASILKEAAGRHQLDAEEFVDHNSDIFKRGTIKPAYWVLRVYLSGSGTSVPYTGLSLRYKEFSLGGEGEGGTSVATSRYKLMKRTPFVGVAVVSVEETCSSFNVTGANLNIGGGYFSRGLEVAYQQSSDGPTRRCILSTSGNMRKSQRAIDRLVGKTR